MRSLRLTDSEGENAPLADDNVGEALVGVLTRAMERGGAPPVALGVREDKVELFDLKPLVEQGVSLRAFVIALTRLEFLAVGLMGRFRGGPQSGTGPAIPMAMVFLEWEDCRWWHWRSLNTDGGAVNDTVTVRRAIDGDPMPSGLGRWWTRGRLGHTHLRVSPPSKERVH